VGQREEEIGKSPAEIREAIIHTRDHLGAHLSALADPQPPSEDDKPMPTPTKRPKSANSTKSATKQTAAKSAKSTKSEKTAMKAKSSSKTKPKSPKKASAGRIAKGAAATAGRVLDTMAAGAVVGAVKAAAQSLDKKKSARQPSTAKVLNEMAPDAAVGAMTGAAQAVIPDNKSPKRRKSAR